MTLLSDWSETFTDLLSGRAGSRRIRVESSPADNAQLDAFGRYRVSNPTTLFSHSSQYDKGEAIWVEKVVGTASATHDPNDATVDLTVGTASGDRVVRQTRAYLRYQPGRSQYIKITAAFGAAQTNTQKLVGYGDDTNGVFFGQDGTGVFVLLRSSSSGTVSDARKVYQSSWNLDSMDGSGSSGITADFTKALIYTIDLEWLGVGRVRCNLVIGGKVYAVHEFLNSGLNTTTYMTTANLPVRYELANTGVAASSSTLKQICSEVESEGGFELETLFPFSTIVEEASLGVGVVNIIPILALRHAATFKSQVNRGTFYPGGIGITASGGRAVVIIYYKPAITGGTWSSVNASSIMEVNTTGTAVSGGIPVSHLVASSSTDNKAVGSAVGSSITSKLPFGLDVDGADPVPLAIAAYALDSGVSIDVTMSWEEIH